ncbi:MAG: alpha/beta hydrolase, partial [Dehalococcoidales bacterium]|nr:alpha/beta hydrolase [Dehalococcoidales bacterium]
TDTLTDFIEALKLKKVIMTGHSLGGRFCIEVALRQPDNVSKLILIDTTGLGGMSLWGTMLQYTFWGVRKAFRIKQPYPTYLLKPGESFHPNYEEDLVKLNIPTYFIWKGLDPYVPISQAKRAVKKIPGSKLIVLKGYGHAPHQKNPKEFNRVFAEALDGG